MSERDRITTARQLPDDFDEYWAEAIDDARRWGSDVTLQPTSTPVHTVETFEISFRGWGGERIGGWLRLPRERHGELPVVIQYLGYGSGRGAAHDALFWASSGFAHLTMDSRGQGIPARTGDSGMPAAVGGILTRGLLDPSTYYYRRLFTDAVRAVDAAATVAGLDRDGIAVLGTSQGGVMALAAAAFCPQVRAVASFVPFLCDIPLSLRSSEADLYREIGMFLGAQHGVVDVALATLSYIDGVNLAAKATAPACFAVGMLDTICPPDTVFAAYDSYSGPKEMTVWEFNGHESGGAADQLLAWEHFHRHLPPYPAQDTAPTGTGVTE